MEDFHLFQDKALQEELTDPISLGKVKAGEKKQYTFYMYNSSMNPYEEIKVNVDHKEVTVISAPKKLDEKQSAEVILEWKPKMDVKRGLKTNIEIEGFEVIG